MCRRSREIIFLCSVYYEHRDTGDATLVCVWGGGGGKGGRLIATTDRRLPRRRDLKIFLSRH